MCPSPSCGVRLSVRGEEKPQVVALNKLDVTSGTLTTSGGANLTATNCYVSDDSPDAKSINTAGGGSITVQGMVEPGHVCLSLIDTGPR